MTQAVRFVVSITIHDGKYDEFETIARAMAEATAQEDGAVAYEFFISPDKKRCRLYEEYRDAAAAFAHLSGRVVGELVPQALGVADLDSFELLGDPGPDVIGIVSGFGARTFGHLHGVSA